MRHIQYVIANIVLDTPFPYTEKIRHCHIKGLLKLRYIQSVLLSGIFTFLASCGGVSINETESDETPQPKTFEAQSFYLENCAQCHGSEGRGTSDFTRLTEKTFTLEELTADIQRMPSPQTPACLGIEGCERGLAEYILTQFANNEQGLVPQFISGSYSRLTRPEYIASLQKAFGIDIDESSLPIDGVIGNFTSNVDLNSETLFSYLVIAESLVDDILNAGFPVCRESAVTACFDENYQEAISDLFRRPLTVEERNAFINVMIEATNNALGDADATRAMLVAALISERFLYRGGINSNAASEVSRSVAERISFALFDSPEERVILAANQGVNAGQAIAREALGLLNSQNSVDTMTRFMAQWLRRDIDKLKRQPNFVNSADFLELEGSVRRAINENYPVTEFINGTDVATIHRDNSDFYDFGGDWSQTLQPTPWDESSARRGILGLDFFYEEVRYRDPSIRKILRGLLVRKSLMCDEIPAPDPDLVEQSEGTDRLLNPQCSSCHLLMDPIGEAFAVYDPDTSSASSTLDLAFSPELNGRYDNLPEFLDSLAQSRTFAQCFSRHWLSFMLEQELAEVDGYWVNELAATIQGGGGLQDVVSQTAVTLHARSTVETQACAADN